MRNKRFMFIALLILAVGFASVSTVLYITGNLAIATSDDFDVYFSGAILDNEDKSNELIKDKKHIVYKTKELKKVNDESVLEYEVTNGSTQYDADVVITCTPNSTDYYEVITTPNALSVEAGHVETGIVTVKQKKYSTEVIEEEFECELVANAVERINTGDDVSKKTTYQITGTLADNSGNVLANKNLVVYSETPHYVTTDDYGFFYVGGLERGSHEVYYMNDIDPSSLTKDEVKEQALDNARISTNESSITFKDISLDDSLIEKEKDNNINIALDADGGKIENNTLELKQYIKGSVLPIPERLSNYQFLGWYDGDKKITSNTIITSDMNVQAKWLQVCSYNSGTVWNYSYRGSSEKFDTPCDGIYKVELWGAQGGNSGGYGAYTVGNIELKSINDLYVYVGGAGSQTPAGAARALAGGYNGGGSTNGQDCCSRVYGTGGGATDVRLIDGDWNNFDGLKSRIMVAAGGGGRFSDSGTAGVAGIGGTLTGGNASGNYADYCVGWGATQTSGGQIAIGTGTYCNSSQVSYTGSGTITGSFGVGGSHGSQGNNGTGGGGGYYGGSSSGHIASAGGGSSFISGYEGCNAISETSTSTNILHTGQSIHYSGLKFTNASMTAGARSGNGYARITLVSID